MQMIVFPKNGKCFSLGPYFAQIGRHAGVYAEGNSAGDVTIQMTRIVGAISPIWVRLFEKMFIDIVVTFILVETTANEFVLNRHMAYWKNVVQWTSCYVSRWSIP
jgi:hypothetical protein